MHVQIQNLIRQNIHLYVHLCKFIKRFCRPKGGTCAYVTDSVLNIKNAFTNRVILQQICTKNKLK